MANFCILPKNVDKFKNGLVKGEISPDKLAKMTSDERKSFLESYVGKAHAGKVNAEFEAKLLLKNQKAGMINWAKNVSGISKQTRMDIISKIERMDKVLDPQEGQSFMASLAERRLGVGVTEAEAKTIADMSKKVTQLAAKQAEDGTWASDAARLEYGRAVFDMTDYVNNLKSAAKSMKLADLKSNPFTFTGKVGENLASNAKAINASLDNSAIFRQGWKTLWTNPKIWAKNAGDSFVTLAKELGGKNVQREVTADIVSRPTYDLMKKAKLAVGNLEEAFPTTVPEKIPVFGRVYKASESAYTGFVQRTRADVFDKYIQIAKDAGVDISDPKELQSIGRLVNSLTGRGSMGKYEAAASTVNNLFFSPRFVKSNIDTFIQPITGAGGSNFVRKQATKNLLKIASGTAAVLATADALMPGSVDWDPRSSDFGKIRVGNTRYDVTGGSGSLVVLASRLASNASKSSSTGVISQLNTGEYGSRSSLDVVSDYFSNKLSPAAGVVRDVLKGKDFNGNKITVGGEIYNLFTPMIVKNYNQLANDPNSGNMLVTLLADGLGLATNTYAAKGSADKPSWEGKDSAELNAFKKQVGNDKFNEAAKKYDQAYNAWINSVKANPDWKKQSSEFQKDLMSKEARQLQKDIFSMYNFKYRRPKTVKTDTSLLKALNEVGK